MDKRLLEILCCPLSKTPVRLLNKTQLEAVNRAIKAGNTQAVNGMVLTQPLTQGLITTDGKLIYRIEDDIPVMLADEAISALQFHEFPA